MKHIEVEVRSFLTKEQYDELSISLTSLGELSATDVQESYYFSGEQDLRIQRNSSGAKIWMKKGNMHDNFREELEIPIEKEYFPTLEALFLALGYTIEIKWYRTRKVYQWDDVTVCLDDTLGYGYIIELERMTTKEDAKDVHRQLQQKLQSLGVTQSPKEEFTQRFSHYKTHWRTLLPSQTTSEG